MDLNVGLPRPNASNWINHWAGLLFNPCTDGQKFKLMVSLFYIMKILTCYVKLSFCSTKMRASFHHSESLLCSLVKLLFHIWSTFKSYCKFGFGVILDGLIFQRKRFYLNFGFDIFSAKVISSVCMVDKVWQMKI